ncbi:MAG: hypothetical protein JTT11_04020 [Candidatus Brockarchaeota archaeon]|nr:hypothetical protein [Candidatus Brockarchaeota archaeon]
MLKVGARAWLAVSPRSACYRWTRRGRKGRTFEGLPKKPGRIKRAGWFTALEVVPLRSFFCWGPDEIKAWL